MSTPSNSLMQWSNPSQGSGGQPGTGQNQFMSYPALPNFNPTSTSTQFNPTSTPFAGQGAGNFGTGMPGGKMDMGGNTFTAPTFNPQFTNQFYQYLQQMLGQGAGMQNNLLSFLQGGPSTMPGAQSLASMANTGNPISAMPEWQAMLDAQQRNISQNQNNLKEQFGFAGALDSSPFGTAMTDYMSQTTKDQNALLAQMQTQAMESAMGRELSASQGIQQEAGGMDQFIQSLLSQGALSSPQLFQKQKTSGIGGLLGGLGSMMGGLGQLGGAAADAGGIGALFAGLI